MADERNQPTENRTDKMSDNVKPDPETLHTTDPQENMSGPVSDSMHKIGEAFETNENKQEAEEKREKNMWPAAD